ncbi:MAG: hypothetical protein ABIP20_16675 [Chthoniobacteraceae bacterium]
MLLLRLLLLFTLLPLTACTDPRANSLSRLKQVDAAELRMEVSRLSTRLFPAAGPTIVPLQPAEWPAPLLKLRPLRMNLYRDGLAVSLQAKPGFEYGLHIVPHGIPEELKSTDRTQYEKLQDGIFYFIQKR